MNITRRTFTAALSLAGASAALGLSPWQFFSPASAQTAAEINQAGERTAEGASQTERASRELGAQVTQLKRLIGAFRV